MWPDRTEDLQRGLRLIPRLGEVMPEDADEQTRRVYEDVRDRLRVPFVNFVFRMLANYPTYLSLSWDRLAPHLLTDSFERASDNLRSQALLASSLDVEDSGLSSLGDLESIRGFTDTIHYVLPKAAPRHKRPGRRPGRRTRLGLGRAGRCGLAGCRRGYERTFDGFVGRSRRSS